LDREMRELLAGMDDHALRLPQLGLTMADGGEKLEPEKPPRAPRRNK
jgi:hypothetical protein